MRPPARRIAGVLALIPTVLLALPAEAYRAERLAARFDDRVVLRAGGTIGTAPSSVEALDPADALGANWRGFRQRHGGVWQIYLDDRTGLPTLVSGRGVVGFAGAADDGAGGDLEGLEQQLRAFLDGNENLLGGRWGSLLELDRAASNELRPGAWKIVFRQQVDGVRVDNARLDFHVADGRLVMFGASNWARPAIGGVPDLDLDAARAVLDEHLGESSLGFPETEPPQLLMLALDAAPASRGKAWTGARGMGLRHALVWRFNFAVPGEIARWVGEVDAHSGALHAFYDHAQYAAIRGGVFPIAPDDDCANGGCEIQGFPMPFADFTEAGQATLFSDTHGNLTCSDPVATYETALAGQFVRINDACGPVAESVSCGQPLELGLKAGENCDVAPGASAGNTAAARSSFYQINRAIEIARHYLPGNTWLTGQLQINTNINNTCNASWTGQLNMFRDGNGCGNTAENQGVLVHEWGHGLDENDGGGFDNPSEAYADVTGIFAARDSCMGRDFNNDGSTCSGYGDTCLTCTGIRDHDFAARQDNTPATPQGFLQTYCPGGGGPCGFESHCAAYPIAEAVYDFAARDLPTMGLDQDSAWQLAERLWYSSRAGSGGVAYTCSLPSSDSCAATSWYQEMRVADDDDGDLANGTPHAAALFAAFDRHNIACGDSGDATNQNSSSCVSLATPALTVTETGNGTELSWGAIADADDYLVYRGEIGCDRQQVAVAAVAGQTTFVDSGIDAWLPRYYRVQARDANLACRSAVSNCAGTPVAARLQKQAHRIDDNGAGNGNAILDPGETAQLPVTLFNSGLADALSVGGRLRVVDGTRARVVDTTADWNGISQGTQDESLSPHFELTVFPAVACGEAIKLEVEMDADGAAPRTARFGIDFGSADRDFINSTSVSIPPLTSEPVISTLALADDRTLTELDISIAINHFDPGALIVELTSPEGTTVRLHNQSSGGFGIDTRYDRDRLPDGPGTMADFVGETTQGTWTVAVEDVITGFGIPGTLVEWTLHTTVEELYDCAPQGCGEPAPTTAVTRLTLEPGDVGGGQIDLVFGWDALAGVSGYHVLQATASTFTGAIELTSATGAGTTALTLADGANITPDLTFFQVRGINSCNWEGP